MEILFVFRHGFKEFYDHRKCDRSGYDIRDGLGYLNSGESKDSVHDTKDCRVITEHAHDGGRAGYSDKGGNAHYYEAAFYAEPESITDTFVFSCAVVEGADWLEALSYAQCYTEEEVYDPGDNAHGCDSGITVRACKAV